MGFRQALQRLEVHQPVDNKIRQSMIDEQKENLNYKQHKQRWSIFSSRRSLSWAAASSHSKTKPRNQTTTTADNDDDDDGGFIPTEFLCPISGCLMGDPAIVSSGHTFDRACLQACYSLGFSPSFPDGSVPDFSAVIPNLALRSTILKWCKQHSLSPPKSLNYSAAENIVRAKMARQKQRKSESENRAIGEIDPMVGNIPEILVSSSSGESVSSIGSSGLSFPIQFVTRPRCYASGSTSSSETDEFLINPEEEEELVAKLNSAQVPEVEEAVISLRKLTRTKDEHNSCCIQLCTPQLLSALRSLIASKYTNVQVNSVACVVNLSLHKKNKVKIVRSGILPPLIEVLKGGFAEAQEHAAGAIFSLALDERGEVGWPSDGAPGANLTAAKVFNQGLINHVVGNKGTPLRPGVPPMDVYIFSLLDEGAKSVLPGNFERHWGIFSFDGQAKYALNLGQGNKLLKNAKNVQYLPSRWCVADSSKDLTNVANHMRIACSEADCTTLNYGGSCNEIGAKGNISYAFNSYYQLNMQNEKSCDFDGLGMVTFLDPSVGECRFLVGVTESNHSSSSCSGLSPRFRVMIWLFFIWATARFFPM